MSQMIIGRNRLLLLLNKTSVYKSINSFQTQTNSTLLIKTNNQTVNDKINITTERYQSSSSSTSPSHNNIYKKGLLLFVSGIVTYFGISYYLDSNNKKKINSLEQNQLLNYSSPNLPGVIKPTKSFKREKNPGNIKITLYQYVTCPFCCKVRAYLDYYGYTYDIVEVNSVTKNQLNWLNGKKMVPCLGIQIPNEKNDGYEILAINESSMIISALETFRYDPSISLKEVIDYYKPMNSVTDNSNDSLINTYFIMFPRKIKDTRTVSQRR
jgi:glutaredoxin-related protein